MQWSEFDGAWSGIVVDRVCEMLVRYAIEADTEIQENPF